MSPAPVIPLPDLLRLVAKVIRYSKGGFNAVEKADLVHDLLELAARLAEVSE